jgi:hypothetical protein
MVMSPAELGTKNNHAGEGQQQFSRPEPTRLLSFSSRTHTLYLSLSLTVVSSQSQRAETRELKKNSVALVRKRTIPTERPPLSAK